MTKEVKWSRKTSDEVNRLLNEYGKVVEDKVPTKKDGNLDMKALQEMKETKELIKKFKKLGIHSNEELFDNGFMAAGMILKF